MSSHLLHTHTTGQAGRPWLLLILLDILRGFCSAKDLIGEVLVLLARSIYDCQEPFSKLSSWA